MMRRATMLLVLASLSVALSACGGGAPGGTAPHAPDEVSEEWTSGDDAPLEGAPAEK